MHATKIACKGGSLLYSKCSLNLRTCRNVEQSEASLFANFVKTAKMNNAIHHSMLRACFDKKWPEKWKLWESDTWQDLKILITSAVKLEEMAEWQNLWWLVDKPTRVNNILDLVLSNRPISVASIESGLLLADVGVLLDHYPVIFEIEVKLELKKAGKRHCYISSKKTDFESLNTC